MFSAEKIVKMINGHNLKSANETTMRNLTNKLVKSIQIDESARCGLAFAIIGVFWYTLSKHTGSKTVREVRDELRSFSEIKEGENDNEVQ